MIEPMDDESQGELISDLAAHGIENRRVLDAMSKLYRADFMPTSHLMEFDPYDDSPASIGEGQTISQPYMVAYMTELINPQEGMRILEIGTGSGYQAALLASLGADVYSIERIEGLFEHSQQALKKYNVKQRLGDGSCGWHQAAPFDAILVACAAENIPLALVEQLVEGGTMIIPLGGSRQHLEVCKKEKGELRRRQDMAVIFVPLVEKE